MAPPHEVPGSAALPMLDVYLPMMRTAGVLAAAELGLFAKLARGPRTAARLAATLRADVHGITRLADLLVTAGYLVRRRGGSYANSAHTRRWFTADGAVDYTAGLAWTRTAWSLVQDLGGAIVRGGPAKSLWQRMRAEPAMGESFAAYMRAFATHTSPQIVRRARLPRDAKRLLDVGGSHGLHSIAFCRAHPELQAVVFDHPVSLQATLRHVAANGMRGRITTRAGDCVRDDLGRGYDVVLCFSVAHNLSAADNARVLRKCARALNPGGLLVVHDYVRGRMPEPYGAAFDLTLLLEVGHHTHTLREFRDQVRAAGLEAFRHTELVPEAMGSLMTARKPRRPR
jgi:2-polyprenyl-3-methyl-5-hydroxy-6-metoxy-1,4-benzoquinol methylase